MGADQSVSWFDDPTPPLSNSSALDACRGVLGRGQLIHAEGSSLAYDAKWRNKVDALVKTCDDETLCVPPPADFAFDVDERTADAEAALLLHQLSVQHPHQQTMP